MPRYRIMASMHREVTEQSAKRGRVTRLRGTTLVTPTGRKHMPRRRRRRLLYVDDDDDASQEAVLLFPVARVDGGHAVTVTVFVPHRPGTNGVL